MPNPLQVLAPHCLSGQSVSDLEKLYSHILNIPEEIQRFILLDILQQAAHTEIGQKYGFSNIQNPEEFARRLPLSTWEDVAPLANRMAEGAPDILFPGFASRFFRTSGSTGPDKLVPQSAAGDAVAKAVTRLRSYYRQAAVAGCEAEPFKEDAPNGKVLLFPAPGHTGATPGGAPIGFASGATAAGTSPRLKAMHACPAWVFAEKNSEMRDFLILYYALSQRDVVAAMGNNPRRFAALLAKGKALAPRLIKAIRTGKPDVLPSPGKAWPDELPLPNPQRADELALLLESGRFSPKYHWPGFNIACFWLAGEMGLALQALRPLLPPNTLYFDAGYGASELKINIPMVPGTPHAPLALFAGFFEFLPEAGGAALTAGQLADGGVYEIVLTTYAGLYRYRLGDLVRVQGFTKNTPNIAFYGRRGECANLAGERVGSALLLQAATQASQKLGLPLAAFALYPNPQAGRYECFYEPGLSSTPPPSESEWGVAFEEALQGLSGGYRRRRQDGSLAPASATRLAPGSKVLAQNAQTQNGQKKTKTILDSSPA